MTETEGRTSSSDPTSSAPDTGQAPYVRLHVTPLDADLLKVIVSAAILPKARNISYHNLETFPEKRYGFVDLPKDDADKLKKKFNGATLRGVKIRIEPARPSLNPEPLGEDAMAKEEKEKKSKKGKEVAGPNKEERKKRKREDEEISGVMLEDGRKVKRGWTTADEPKEKRSKKDKKDKKDKKKKKKQERSKYTDHSECLVKTILPPNAEAENKTTKKKKKGKSREVVIHEFEKTTKFPTFLKASTSTTAPNAPLEYVEDKGWVDEDGKVVEEVKTRPAPVFKIKSSKKADKKVSKSASEEESASESSDGADSDDESASDDDSEEPVAAVTAEASTPAPKSTRPDLTLPLHPSSASPLGLGSEPSRPKSAGSVRSLAIKIPPTTPSEPRVVHPLEALYKRSQNPDREAGEPESGTKAFSFFGNGDADSAEDEDAAEAEGGQLMPMTPFTRQDFEQRGIRSAAPTPDTAYPKAGRFKPWADDMASLEEDDEDEDDDHKDDEGASVRQAGDADGEKSTSEFQKWFWENRGDLNRSWRKRRKTASKEKRYRENRARMARAI